VTLINQWLKNPDILIVGGTYNGLMAIDFSDISNPVPIIEFTH